jgi:tRNA G46 methylase TrmB
LITPSAQTVIRTSSESMRLSFALKSSSKVIVEFGMGDGRLLKKLVDRGSDIKLKTSSATFTYIGIEIDRKQFEVAEWHMKLDKNVILLNASFEEIIPMFPDGSIDQILDVLPDPAYIDRPNQNRWQPFYKIVYSKLKSGGLLRLVTEITDDLLEPVSDEVYHNWVHWLSGNFRSIGFRIWNRLDGAPHEYSTRCLTQFRGDAERIRIVTLDLVKCHVYGEL